MDLEDHPPRPKPRRATKRPRLRPTARARPPPRGTMWRPPCPRNPAARSRPSPSASVGSRISSVPRKSGTGRSTSFTSATSHGAPSTSRGAPALLLPGHSAEQAGDPAHRLREARPETPRGPPPPGEPSALGGVPTRAPRPAPVRRGGGWTPTPGPAPRGVLPRRPHDPPALTAAPVRTTASSTSFRSPSRLRPGPSGGSPPIPTTSAPSRAPSASSPPGPDAPARSHAHGVVHGDGSGPDGPAGSPVAPASSLPFGSPDDAPRRTPRPGRPRRGDEVVAPDLHAEEGVGLRRDVDAEEAVGAVYPLASTERRLGSSWRPGAGLHVVGAGVAGGRGRERASNGPARARVEGRCRRRRHLPARSLAAAPQPKDDGDGHRRGDRPRAGRGAPNALARVPVARRDRTQGLAGGGRHALRLRRVDGPVSTRRRTRSSTSWPCGT